jgi:phosphatidate cytidylyltransferase
MKRVLTAVVLLPLVLLVVFRAPLWLFSLVIAGIVMLALSEYLGIAKAAGLKPFKLLTYALALLPFVLLWIKWPSESASHKVSFDFFFLLYWLYVLMAAAIVFGVPLIFRKDLLAGLGSCAASLLGLVYVGVSLSLLVCLRADEWEEVLVVFVLFSVWAGDIAAYYVGRSIGKHKLAPVVSPNKSWEGAIASIVASVATAILVLHFRFEISEAFKSYRVQSGGSWTFYHPIRHSLLGHAIFLGILTNVAAQFGDLFESALKRGAGVKDSGTLLPGHGGILDRIDALLFAIPVAWYYATFSGFLTQNIIFGVYPVFK